MNNLELLLEHLARQHKLNPTASKLIVYLYTKRDNRDAFQWTSRHTMDAANALEITHESIKKAMTQLTKAGLIEKIDRAMYHYTLPEITTGKVILTYEFNNKTVNTTITNG